jgi:hypothetical protein
MSAHDEAARPGGATLAARRMLDMDPHRTKYQTDAQGRRTAVVLPISEYEQLLEDLHDLAVVAERRDEETIDEAELRRRLAGDGAV